MKEELKEKWSLFFRLLLDPWNLIMMISLGALFYWSASTQLEEVKTLLIILITISSAVVGSRFTLQWERIREGGSLFARGGMAVRSLKLLLGKTYALEARVKVFRSDVENHEDLLAQRNLEEILEGYNGLQEDVVNAIENWTDIVPEADLKSQVGMITKLKEDLELKEQEAGEILRKYNSLGASAKVEKSELEKKLKKANSELQSMRIDIMGRQSDFGVGNILGSGASPATNYILDAMTTPRATDQLRDFIIQTGLQPQRGALFDAGIAVDPSNKCVKDDT